MRTKYVFDTSALINNPYIFEKFHNSDCILPIFVLNELDKLKKMPAEVGKNARVVIRLLEEISNLGDISTGVLLKNDILLKVDVDYLDLSDPFYKSFGDPTYGDTQILACAYTHWREHTEHDVVLVSNDINLRIKAKARGIPSEAHEDKTHCINDLFTGNQVIKNEDAGLELQQHGQLDPRCFDIKLLPNECVLFEADNGDGISMGRLVSDNKIKSIKKNYPWNLSSRNKEQTFAIDLIMDKKIDLVTLIGIAGSGKSLISLASALELVLNRREYNKLVIYRPIQPVGKDIGFLPGLLNEKLAPWFQAIMDNLEILFSNKNGGDWKRELEMYQKKSKIEMEAITYIRGRSIPNSIILIDEAQNISKEDIKTILTRVGENTKIILTGDLDQIDNNSLDAVNNGLTYVIEKFKESELAGHITFTQGERSRLATEAAKIL